MFITADFSSVKEPFGSNPKVPPITADRLAITRQRHVLILKWLRSLGRDGHLTDWECNFVAMLLNEPDDPLTSSEAITLFELWAARLIYRHNGVPARVMVSSWRQHCQERDRVAAGEALLATIPDRLGVLKRT